MCVNGGVEDWSKKVEVSCHLKVVWVLFEFPQCRTKSKEASEPLVRRKGVKKCSLKGVVRLWLVWEPLQMFPPSRRSSGVPVSMRVLTRIPYDVAFLLLPCSPQHISYPFKSALSIVFLLLATLTSAASILLFRWAGFLARHSLPSYCFDSVAL